MTSLGTIPRRLVECGGAVEEPGGLWHIVQERAYANAMGCDWMSNREARQAIPPAYTELIGLQLAQHIRAQRAAA